MGKILGRREGAEIQGSGVLGILLFNPGSSYTSNHFIIFMKLDIYVLCNFKCVLYFTIELNTWYHYGPRL